MDAVVWGLLGVGIFWEQEIQGAKYYWQHHILVMGMQIDDGF